MRKKIGRGGERCVWSGRVWGEGGGWSEFILQTIHFLLLWGKVFFYKLTKNPNLTKKTFFFFGGGGGGGRGEGLSIGIGGGGVCAHEQMFQMALLLFKENTCAKLFWNSCIYIGVMAQKSSFMRLCDLQVWPWPSTYLKKCFKWHFSSSRTATVSKKFEIHA